MKIGILTFHRANNYGAVLQCMALQSFLSDMGHDVYVIDYVNEQLRKKYRFFSIDKVSVRKVAAAFYNIDLNIKRNKQFRMFRQKNLRLSEERNLKANQLAILNSKYDLFVVGSDQVWNPSLTNWDKNYFLDFASPGKRFSYAASLGNSCSDNRTVEFYKNCLSQFELISVRESSSSKVLESILGKRVLCNIDPVFLLPVEKWNGLTGDRNVPENYIFVYSLHESKPYEIAKKLAEKEGAKIVTIPSSKRIKIQGISNISASVNDFLNYIRYADYVITDSFHALAFSILFRKRFVAVRKEKLTGLNSRLESLLDTFNLNDHIYTQEIEVDSNIDYNSVERIIGEKRAEAEALFSSLEKTNE